MPQVMMKDGSSEKIWIIYIVSIDVCWIHFFGQGEENTHYMMWVKNVKFKVLVLIAVFPYLTRYFIVNPKSSNGN